MVDAGSVGTFGFQWEKGSDGKQRRLSQALLFLRMGDQDDNGYGHPIDGLIPIVDVNEVKVIHIEEHDSDPIPKGMTMSSLFGLSSHIPPSL
jgi:primary-amine oxidase